MKRSLAMILACLLLTGCGPQKQQEPSIPETETAPLAAPITEQGQAQYVSPLGAPTIITLSDDGILVDRLDSGADEDAVVVTHDIQGEYGHGAHRACADAVVQVSRQV